MRVGGKAGKGGGQPALSRIPRGGNSRVFGPTPLKDKTWGGGETIVEAKTPPGGKDQQKTTRKGGEELV